MKLQKLFFLMFVPFFLTGCLASREGIGTLLDLKKDQESQNAYLTQELNAFKGVHKALQKNKIQPGQSEVEVLTIIGDPVERYPEGDLERWLYQDSRKGWFARSKIYLYFNADKRFVKWKCVNTECPETPSS